MKKDAGKGRPTKYEEKSSEIARDYAVSYGAGETPDAVPTIAGLAIRLGVARSTLYLWAKDHPDFSDALETVLMHQERALVNGGLTNTFNAPITKLMMGGHGYSEKQEVDHRSGDGSMSPRTLDDFYADLASSTDTKSDAS